MKRMLKMYFKRSLLTWTNAEIAKVGRDAVVALRLRLSEKSLRLVQYEGDK